MIDYLREWKHYYLEGKTFIKLSGGYRGMIDFPTYLMRNGEKTKDTGKSRLGEKKERKQA